MEDSSRKKLIEDITKTLRENDFDAGEIADTISFLLTLRKLRQIQHEIDGLYAPPESEPESKAIL